MAERRYDITINDHACTWADGCEMLRPMLRREAVVSAGGYLLKAGADEQRLVLDIQPNFINGQRAYHYDMILPDSFAPVMRGDIRPDGAVALLFGPESLDANPARLRRACILAARALRDAGLPGNRPIPNVSRMNLREAGAFDTPPETLAELADAAGPMT